MVHFHTGATPRTQSGRLPPHNNLFPYPSTRRTGQDTDIWVMDAADPKTDRMLLQLQGGGWRPLDWSPDNRKLLVQEEVSISQSYLWLVDIGSGQKTQLTPKTPNVEIAYTEARFSKD